MSFGRLSAHSGLTKTQKPSKNASTSIKAVELSISVNGEEASGKAKARFSGLTGLLTRAIGKTTELMATESLSTLLETSMKDSGTGIKLVAKGHTGVLTQVALTWATGRMTCSMGRVLRLGRMGVSTKESSSSAKKVAWESRCGLTSLCS